MFRSSWSIAFQVSRDKSDYLFTILLRVKQLEDPIASMTKEEKNRTSVYLMLLVLQ